MKFSSLLFCVLTGYVLSAQDIVLENNPPSVKWRQIVTPNFQIIFPDGFEQQGQRMANTLEHIRDAEMKTLRSSPKRLPVLLQNQSAISNGFVSYLPRRSEFYTMPSQDYNFLGTNDWLNLLAAHEYRHAIQFEHANRGFNRLFYYLFGPTTMVGMAQIAVPQWFWEGDAVATETALTPSGRGRIPNFGLLFRTNLLEGRTFNYHKQYLRSFKHQIPDHYVLGYHMVNYLRSRTNDPHIWDKITARTWSVPFLPFAFSNAIKKESGVRVSKLYREMARDLKAEWQKEQAGLTISAFETFASGRRQGYTDYQYPQAVADGVIAMRSGIGHIQQFVKLSGDGVPKVIFTPGFVNDAGMLSLGSRLLVWTEFGFDPRWNVRTFSRIKAVDIETGKQINIGDKRGRFGSAAISKDDQRIAAIETSTDYRTSLVILAVDGSELKRFDAGTNEFFSMPRWSDDNKGVIVLKTNADGKRIVLIDVESGQERNITSASHENVGAPLIHRNFVIFNSPATGIDNLFAIDLTNNTRYQITSSKYGAYNASVSGDGNRIYYSNQTRDGLNVVSIPFDPSSWSAFSGATENNSGYQTLVEHEAAPDLFKNVPATNYPVKGYSKLRGLFNPYSWGMYFDNDFTGANIGVSSQDLLSTTRVEVGYRYDIAEQTSGYRAAVSYQALFPIIDVTANKRNRSVTEEYDSDTNVDFDWDELNIEAGLRVPLNLTSSKYQAGVSGGAVFGLTRVTDFENSLDGDGRIFVDYLNNGTLTYNRVQFDAYRLLKMARRDINSKWGQTITATYTNTLNPSGSLGSDFRGEQFATYGVLYLPGVMRHHSLWGWAGFQYTFMDIFPDNTIAGNNYWFPNQVPVPRGIGVGRHRHFYTTSANYAFPVWYPDIAIGPFVNIQRLRANLFYDYAYGKTTRNEDIDPDRHYASTGIEGRVDVNLFRTLPQFSFGLRYTYGLEPSDTAIEILIGMINF